MVPDSTQRGFSMLELMVVVAIIGIMAVVTVPVASRTMGDMRLRGDAHRVSNMVSVAKMRAAAEFSRARVYVALADNTFKLQVWNRTTLEWITEGGELETSSGVTFGTAGISSPPPSTQDSIAQAPECRDDSGNTITNTSCIVFNSRGIPVLPSGVPNTNDPPTGNDALYITDGVTGVYATTITATPLVRLWWTPAQTAAWMKQ